MSGSLICGRPPISITVLLLHASIIRAYLMLHRARCHQAITVPEAMQVRFMLCFPNNIRMNMLMMHYCVKCHIVKESQ